MQKSSFLHELMAMSCFMRMSLAVISSNSIAHPAYALNSSAVLILADTDVIINEIHYNPCGDQGSDSDYEFVELFNSGTTTVDLSGWYFSNGITFTFPNGSSIAAGEYIVIAINASIYAGNGYQVFDFGGGLSNSGEQIRLRDENGNTIDDVTYDDNNAWPDADGDNDLLELTIQENALQLDVKQAYEEEVLISIFNTSGQRISQQKQVQLDLGALLVPTSDLAMGVYYITVSAQSKVLFSQQFIQP